MKELVALVFVAVIIGLSVSCRVAQYGECRRVHPAWYCVVNE